MILNCLLLLGGLFLLCKGADIVVEASVKVARVLNVSEMLIGLTLVCLGTSLPELFLSVAGALKGTSSLIVGNIVGTNIFNIAGILGMICVITPIKLLRDTVKKDMGMALITAITFLLLIIDTATTALTQNVITRADGSILLILFGIYMYYTLYQFDGLTEKGRMRIAAKREGKVFEITKISKETKIELIRNILLCLIGCIMIYIGSEITIYGASGIAVILGLSETLIAILIIAVGTSLPEMITSVSAIKRGSINIAIGNLIGSTMFNMLFVVGMAAVIRPIVLVSSAIWVDCIVFIVISIIIITFSKARFLNKGQYELSRIEGLLLVVIYVVYLVYVVLRG